MYKVKDEVVGLFGSLPRFFTGKIQFIFVSCVYFRKGGIKPACLGRYY